MTTSIPQPTTSTGLTQSSPERAMVRVELMGAHSHAAENGKLVHVYMRDGKYLARGRIGGRPFGQTLGSDPAQASCQLRRLLTEIDDCTYMRPSERVGQLISTGTMARHTIRTLCAAFLAEKRNTVGKKTTGTYRGRLVPIIEFAELPESVAKWSLAANMDRRFAVDFRAYLVNRTVTRNGRVGGQNRPMSDRQIRNVLQCCATMINWALRADVNQLPRQFANPFTREFVGARRQKDPLRPTTITLSDRLAMVAVMDEWQLLHLCLPFTCAIRPEDYAGLLISEIDFENHRLQFGTRFDGADFNKGRQEFCVPFPAELIPLLRALVGMRRAGPLLRSRHVYCARRRPSPAVSSNEELTHAVRQALVTASNADVQSAQDRKQVVRSVLQRLGGTSPDELAREFQKLRQLAGLTTASRFYDLKAAVSTEMQTAGVSHLVQRYVTGHTTADILDEYVSLQDSLVPDMRRYFNHVRPLLDAFTCRAQQLGLCGPRVVARVNPIEAPPHEAYNAIAS